MTRNNTLLTAIAYSISTLLVAADQAPPKGFEKIDQEIKITTLRAQMKYDVHSFSVKPGSKVKLTFVNPDDLPHNLIICTPGKSKGKDKGKELVDAVLALGEKGVELNWEPKEHPRLLHSVGMAQPQETKVLYFTAPKSEGNYPYVCTFPGHFQLMNGMMVVSKLANPITNLTYEYYEGDWNKLPDFCPLEPKEKGFLPKGLFDISPRKRGDKFGFVFKGNIDCPEDGDYVFDLGSDDGSRLLVDGKVIIDHDNIHAHSNKSGKAKLTEGKHDIEVLYFEQGGQESLYVGWSGPGFKNQPLSLGSPGSSNNSSKTGIPLVPPAGEASIYRNFIADAGPRAIGVGYSEGVNFAFDANNMRVAMVWQGDFMDGARHWQGRGQGYQPPSGEDVAKFPDGIAFTVLETPESAWPQAEYRTSELKFKGYKLDKKQHPTFLYERGDLKFEDTAKPSTGKLERTIHIKAPGNGPDNLYFRAASGALPKNGESYSLSEYVTLQVNGAEPSKVPNELRFPVTFKNGEASLHITYQWVQ